MATENEAIELTNSTELLIVSDISIPPEDSKVKLKLSVQDFSANPSSPPSV